MESARFTVSPFARPAWEQQPPEKSAGFPAATEHEPSPFQNAMVVGSMIACFSSLSKSVTPIGPKLRSWAVDSAPRYSAQLHGEIGNWLSLLILRQREMLATD